MNIPDIHRRERVKDADLVKEEFPMERTLRVYFEYCKRCFMFQGEPKGETIKSEKNVIYGLSF